MLAGSARAAVVGAQGWAWCRHVTVARWFSSAFTVQGIGCGRRKWCTLCKSTRRLPSPVCVSVIKPILDGSGVVWYRCVALSTDEREIDPANRAQY